VKEGDVASGYEKDACGVDPKHGWDVRSRRPRLQALVDRALLVCGCLWFGASLWDGWKLFFG
jgi:hypothetical protein